MKNLKKIRHRNLRCSQLAVYYLEVENEDQKEEDENGEVEESEEDD